MCQRIHDETQRRISTGHRDSDAERADADAEDDAVQAQHQNPSHSESLPLANGGATPPADATRANETAIARSPATNGIVSKRQDEEEAAEEDTGAAEALEDAAAKPLSEKFANGHSAHPNGIGIVAESLPEAGAASPSASASEGATGGSRQHQPQHQCSVRVGQLLGMGCTHEHRARELFTRLSAGAIAPTYSHLALVRVRAQVRVRCSGTRGLRASHCLCGSRTASWSPITTASRSSPTNSARLLLLQFIVYYNYSLLYYIQSLKF